MELKETIQNTIEQLNKATKVLNYIRTMSPELLKEAIQYAERTENEPN